MKIIFLLTFLLSLPVSASSNVEALKLTSGDKVAVFVSDSPELSSKKKVGIDGSMTLPLIGKIVVEGLTTGEAEKRIEKALKEGNFLRQPKVQLSHIQSVKNVATILGQIPKPGKYSIRESNKNVIDIIAIAGGITAMHKGVLIRNIHGERQEFNFKLEKLLLNTKASQLNTKNFELRPGDIVYINKAPMYYTYGEFGTVGTFELQKDLTLMQAISIAGGLTKFADDNDIKIKRKYKQGYKLIKASLNEIIQEDDIIVVDESLF